ncbi:hypothetical protein ACJX0J_020589, partial [Zea mays]
LYHDLFKARANFNGVLVLLFSITFLIFLRFGQKYIFKQCVCCYSYYSLNHGVYYFFLIQNLFDQIWLNITQVMNFSSSLQAIECHLSGLDLEFARYEGAKTGLSL